MYVDLRRSNPYCLRVNFGIVGNEIPFINCFHVYKFIKYIYFLHLSVIKVIISYAVPVFHINDWQKILDVDLQTGVGIKCFKKLHNGRFCSEHFENFLLMVDTDFRKETAFFSVPNK